MADIGHGDWATLTQHRTICHTVLANSAWRTIARPCRTATRCKRPCMFGKTRYGESSPYTKTPCRALRNGNICIKPAHIQHSINTALQMKINASLGLQNLRTAQAFFPSKGLAIFAGAYCMELGTMRSSGKTTWKTFCKWWMIGSIPEHSQKMHLKKLDEWHKSGL